MTTPDPIKTIADAVLYEGYVLWPYRRSAMKNQRRFTFGGVYPPAHSGAHPDDPCTMQTEVLVRGAPVVEITIRFLQVVQRTVLDSAGRPVDQLEIDGQRYVTWEEAVEREVRAPARIAIPAGQDCEDLARGSLLRSWEALEGVVEVDATPVAAGVHRLTVSVQNLTAFPDGGSRQDALRRTFCSTHTLLRAAEGGEFVSLADPPPDLAEAAAACCNTGTWPVLVGDASTMLSSPIILEDFPRVAPESPGDMFDGGEIDQLLILNILALTDEEKAEMAATDARSREILERVEALTPDQLMALHGTIR
jgi:hypothetical protein